MFNAKPLRTLPSQFSWVDQRLVRDRHIDRLTLPAMGLYLFLITVADHTGTSFYADKTLQKRLNLSPGVFQQARSQLIEQGLIAYQKPLYFVLSLPHQHAPPSPDPPKNKTTALQSLKTLLQTLEKKGDHL